MRLLFFRKKPNMSKKRIIIIIASVLLIPILAVGGFFCGRELTKHLANRYTLLVQPEGEGVYQIEYGTAFEAPGATAMFSGTHLNTEPVEVPVTVSSDVDTQKLGTYLIKYTAQYKNYLGTAYRQVEVVDTQAPVITLTADPEKFTLPGETYEEEGYQAVDNRDGDLTEQVSRKVSKNKIIYTVADLSGNVAEVERKIVYSDPVPPAIALNGSKYITLLTGQTYQEPGFVAADNLDGNLSGKVKISGKVDTEKAGVYTLKYSVTDSYGNKATASRKITVITGNGDADTVIPGGKVIYLTFDDGPGPHTARLLNILKKYNVKATFFVTDKPKYNHLMKRMAKEGHSVAIHTMTHTYKSIYASDEAYFDDLYGMQEIIKKQTGIETTLVRFPGGSSNTVSRKYNSGIMTRLTHSLTQLGFRYFDWNVDSNDAGGTKTAAGVYRNVINGVSKKKVAVVLQHDVKSYSVDAVERIIVWGLENGYAFLPLNASSPTCHHNIRN